MAGIIFQNLFTKEKVCLTFFLKFSKLFKYKLHLIKTFRPKKNIESNTSRIDFDFHSESFSSGEDLRESVKLPSSEDLNDWIAIHVVDFFNRINLLYGIVSEYCTKETCPIMSGGPKYEYLWCDNLSYKKPTHLPAEKYIGLLMEWIENQVNDETLFPCTKDIPFPKNFHANCKKLVNRLFRVFVHVYIHHFDRITQIGAEAHVNTCYKQFIYFALEFNLLRKEEIQPLVIYYHILIKFFYI